MQGDVYVGTDSVKYLADGVADRVFFATNESILTTASRETLRAQAAWLRENSNITVVLEGHADERGTREYNLALRSEEHTSDSSHTVISYAVFCLKKKKKKQKNILKKFNCLTTYDKQ